MIELSKLKKIESCPRCKSKMFTSTGIQYGNYCIRFCVDTECHLLLVRQYDNTNSDFYEITTEQKYELKLQSVKRSGSC